MATSKWSSNPRGASTARNPFYVFAIDDRPCGREEDHDDGHVINKYQISLFISFSYINRRFKRFEIVVSIAGNLK